MYFIDVYRWEGHTVMCAIPYKYSHTGHNPRGSRNTMKRSLLFCSPFARRSGSLTSTVARFLNRNSQHRKELHNRSHRPLADGAPQGGNEGYAREDTWSGGQDSSLIVSFLQVLSET